MSAVDLFLVELEQQTIPHKNYRKHGETMLKYSIIQPDTIYFDEYIALNPLGANRTAKILCRLADKHKIKMTAIVEPFWVGPSIIQKELFFRGMRLERLLDWYRYYGFTITENNKIIREPK
jgi:hypothetical protein